MLVSTPRTAVVIHLPTCFVPPGLVHVLASTSVTRRLLTIDHFTVSTTGPDGESCSSQSRLISTYPNNNAIIPHYPMSVRYFSSSQKHFIIDTDSKPPCSTQLESFLHHKARNATKSILNHLRTFIMISLHVYNTSRVHRQRVFYVTKLNRGLRYVS